MCFDVVLRPVVRIYLSNGRAFSLEDVCPPLYASIFSYQSCHGTQQSRAEDIVSDRGVWRARQAGDGLGRVGAPPYLSSPALWNSKRGLNGPEPVDIVSRRWGLSVLFCPKKVPPGIRFVDGRGATIDTNTVDTPRRAGGIPGCPSSHRIFPTHSGNTPAHSLPTTSTTVVDYFDRSSN
jgi:hypothetical protein